MIFSLLGLSFHSKNRIVNGLFLFITFDGIFKSTNPTLVICYEVLGPKTGPAILQCMRDIIRTVTFSLKSKSLVEAKEKG